MNALYDDISGFCGIRMLVGVYRHAPMCRAGLYLVVPCFGTGFRINPMDAVVDDFGNLVAVPA